MESAVTDTSSLILLEKSGLLPPLSRLLRLVTVYQVWEEYEAGSDNGKFPAGIDLIEGPNEAGADEGVLLAARRKGLPLLSEDRKLLLRAEKAGIPYYNALMMLEFVLSRGGMDPADYENRKTRLLASARYSPRVRAYTERLHWEVRKRI